MKISQVQAEFSGNKLPHLRAASKPEPNMVI